MPYSQSRFLGMDLDTSYSLRDGKKYFKLRNGELLIDEELAVGTISNVNGNKKNFIIPSTLTDIGGKGFPYETLLVGRVIGATSIDDWVVIFAAQEGTHVNINDDGSSPPLPPYDERYGGSIWAFKYNADGSIKDAQYDSVEDIYILTEEYHLKFYDRMHFSENNFVAIVSNSEGPGIKKVYFTDGINVVRFLNIMEDNISTPLNQIEMIADVNMSQPKAEVVTGGSFPIGTVQYAYQQFNYNGAETRYSICSNLVNISREEYTRQYSDKFVGTGYVTNDFPTNKAVKVTIDDIDDRFNSIRILRVFYNSEYGTPEITIVAEMNHNDSVMFIDDGAVTLGTVSWQEFETVGTVLFSGEDLTVANKRMIAGNIKEDFYNPDYDARAYRFQNASFTGMASVWNSELTERYDIDPNGDWQHYIVGQGYVDNGADWDIPEDWDCVINDFENDMYTDSNSNIFGGTGKNISFEFDITPKDTDGFKFTLDSSVMSIDTGDVGVSLGDPIVVDPAPVPEAVDKSEHVCYSEYGTQDWQTVLDYTFEVNEGYSDYSSEINSGQLRGYQNGEIYRFGIVLFDQKGRKSPAKWICDVRFPYYWETDSKGSYWHLEEPNNSTSEIGKANGKILYIKFNVNNLPDDTVNYQIVRVKRTEKDMSILANGYITPTYKWGVQTGEDSDPYEWYRPTGALMRNRISDSSVAHIATGASATLYYGRRVDYQDGLGKHVATIYHNKLFNFWSPELSFGNRIDLRETELVLYGKSIRDYAFEQPTYNPENHDDYPHPYILLHKSRYVAPLSTSNKYYTVGIDDNEIFTDETGKVTYTMDGNEYKHYTKYQFKDTGSHSRDVHGQGGKGALINLKNELTLDSSDVDQYTILFGYIKRNLSVQYGGNSYEARKANTYIPASNLYKIDDTLANTFGGDVYVSMFEHLRTYMPSGNELISASRASDCADFYCITKQMVNISIVPIQSVINCAWRGDKLYTKNESDYKGNVNENKGVYTNYDGYTQMETDAYYMNWTFQRYNDSHQYMEEPLFFDKLITDLNHRMVASDAKYDGESSDSWLKFKANNYKEVEGENGPITALEAFSDFVYFFQTKGIGGVQIDERALVNDTEGVSLVLGTGDIFSKVQYLTTDFGVNDIRAVVRAKTGVYFFDYINKTLASVNKGGVVDLGKKFGVKSFLKNNIDKYMDETASMIAWDYGAVLSYDDTKNAVYLTFLNNYNNNSKESFTIEFNEDMQAFTSFHDFIPYTFVNSKDKFITFPRCHVNDGGCNDKIGWIHNIGNKGEYYGDVNDTIITILTSEMPSITKVFDALEYTHDSIEFPGIPPTENDTFSLIRVYNNFIDTGQIAFNPKFRFRTWRAKLPRYQENGRKYRITGKYAKIELHFDNTDNKPLYLQPIITFWRPIAFVEH